MNKINEMFEKIKNLEEVLTEYNTSKNKIEYLEKEISNLKNKKFEEEKQNVKTKIYKIEEDLIKVNEEIRKIDLYSKECYTLSDIKMLLDFVKEEEILTKKVLGYLDSLILLIYLEPKTVKEFFKNTPKIEGRAVKTLKINLDLDEFMRIIRKNEKLFFICENAIRKKLSEDMKKFTVPRINCYVDEKNLYILYLIPVNEEPTEDCFFGVYKFVEVDFINNLTFTLEIFNEIFKRNLCRLLLDFDLSSNDLITTNSFLSQTEFYITDIEEWKLDCAMKEIINLSRKERKWETVCWLKETSLIGKEGDSVDGKVDGDSKEPNKVNNDNIDNYDNIDHPLLLDLSKPEFLPKEISINFYKILLCIKIITLCKSKRIKKAEQFVERALLKMMNQTIDPILLHQFILFAELTVLVRVLPHSKIIPDLSNLREEIFFMISKKSTEITKSLIEPLLLLKVYFKEKHYDFISLTDKFVPQRSKLAFEINFFNLVYANVCDLILCIKYIEHEKIIEMTRFIGYILGLSNKVPSGCIEQFKRLESFKFIFESSPEEIMKNKSKLEISEKDLEILMKLINR